MYIVKWAASWLLNVYLADFSEILKAACMRWATQPCRKFSKVISIGFVHSTNCISGWFLGFFSQQHVCSRRHDSFWAHAGQCICQLAGAAAMGRYVCGSYMTYVYVWHGMYSYVCHECFCKLDSAIAVGRYVCSCHSTYVHEWHGMYSYGMYSYGMYSYVCFVNWIVPLLWAGMYVVITWHTYTSDMGCIHVCVMNAFVNWIVPLLWAGMYVVITRHTYTSDMGCIHVCVMNAFVNWIVPLLKAFLGGYWGTVQGLLDWFEVDLGFTELLFIQIDLCVMCVFVLYSPVSLSPLL